MNWIKKQDDSISQYMPVVAFGRDEDDSSETPRMRMASYNDDSDYECDENGDILEVKFLYEFLCPDTKWITDEDEMKRVDKDGKKFIVWGYPYESGRAVDRSRKREYYVATCTDYKFFDHDGNRLWAFAVSVIPDLPCAQYENIINEFDNIEEYYTVKLKGERTMVETASGRKGCVKYNSKFYNVDEPVRLKSKSICVSYID